MYPMIVSSRILDITCPMSGFYSKHEQFFYGKTQTCPFVFMVTLAKMVDWGRLKKLEKMEIETEKPTEKKITKLIYFQF